MAGQATYGLAVTITIRHRPLMWLQALRHALTTPSLGLSNLWPPLPGCLMDLVSQPTAPRLPPRSFTLSALCYTVVQQHTISMWLRRRQPSLQENLS